MNVAAVQRLRDLFAHDQPAYGLWITLESPSIAEMAVALGLDWIVLDAEHGHLDWHDLVNHLRAVVRSTTVCLIRVAELNGSLIKRALDLGADGVVVPWVETADQLRAAVRMAHYPPKGLRGIGAERATCWGQCFDEHVQQAEAHVMVVPIIETVAGGRNVRQLVAVDGVDTFFFGPADYSATAGYPGQWEGPGVAQQIEEAKTVIRYAGKQCGVVATGPDNMRRRRDQGFRMIGIGLDGGLLVRSIRAALQTVHRDAALHPDLTPENGSGPPPPPAPRPPESMRPDREERMVARGDGALVQIAPGVRFECMVGKHVEARHLTTGIVTFEPGAALAYHLHPFAESVTVLHGDVAFEVEGRTYALSPVDNITVPAGVPHYAVNRSATDIAIMHVALATSDPTRELVDRFFSRRSMPRDSNGTPGAERVTRSASAPTYSPGPNTSFIDYFNADLVPGLDMSGGYGEFTRGGRLPAHVHDFDESICIVRGSAACIVEGRRYTLSDFGTALQPRGRVHYFINEAPDMMAMIWVYAGPLPQRLIVDERCATVEGDPWQQMEATA